MINNGDVGLIGLNERLSFGNSEIDKKLSLLELVSSNVEGVLLYEGLNINFINFWFYNLGFEYGDINVGFSYVSYNFIEVNVRLGIDSSSVKEFLSYEC